MTDLLQWTSVAVLAVAHGWWLVMLTRRVHHEKQVNDERWRRRHEP